MTVVFLRLEIDAFGERFADELATALELRLVDLRPLDLGIAELHAFGAEPSQCTQQPSSAIEDLSVRAANAALEAAAAGNVLIVGWSTADVLAPLSNVIRICARAPRPRGAWRSVRRFGYDNDNVAPAETEPSEPLLIRVMRAAFGLKWRASCDFDLIVEADRSSAQDCRREIVDHVRRRESGTRTATATELAQLRALLGNAANGALDWRSLRSCAVSVGGDDVPLTGIDSQEGAIARIERNLHGYHRTSPPTNPLCLKPLD